MAEHKSAWGFAEGSEIVPGRRCIRSLGGGARFEAFTAIDDEMITTVVVKMPRPDHAQDPESRAMLAREGEILARLAHPSIVRLYAADVDAEPPYLVLEHLEGPTLRRLLKMYGPLALEQAIPLGVTLSAALHYCARRDVVHLDVKPANILMSVVPRLIDFGVARTPTQARALKAPIGTRQYMAPEQCLPDGRVGPAADVWGLAVTLYRAMTGRRPFPSGTPGAADLHERYPQLHADPADLPATVPGEIRALLRACLEKDPLRRPTAAELNQGLEPYVAALPRRPVLGRRRPKVR